MAKKDKETRAKEAKEAAAVLASMPLAERRQQGLKAMLAGVNKKFGANSIGYAAGLGYKPVPRVSSGIFILDYALGGGWPRGRVNVVWGDRSSSKTTTMLRSIAQAQKTDVTTGEFIWERQAQLALIEARDVAFLIEYLQPYEPKLAQQLVQKVDDEKLLQKAVDAATEAFAPIIPMRVQFIDMEGALDFPWARRLGVNTEELIYSRPDCSEEGAEQVEAALASSGVDMSVLDSLAAMTPKAEAEGEMEDHHVGLAARINSKMFRKVQSAINRVYRQTEGKVLPTLMVINQIRQKVGVMYGSPDIKPGGVAQDFYGSTETKFSGNKVKYFDGDSKQLPKSSEFNFVVVKNKVSPPKIHGSFEMMLVDDDKDGGLLAGEIIEVKEVMEFAAQVGIYGKTDDEKQFRMYKDVMDTKRAIYEKYVVDRQRFASLKRDVVAKLVPKQ